MFLAGEGPRFGSFGASFTTGLFSFGDSGRFSLVGVVERTAGEGGRCFGLDADEGEVPLVVAGLLVLGEVRTRVDETVEEALLESDLADEGRFLSELLLRNGTLAFDEVVESSSRSRFIDRAIEARVGANNRELTTDGSVNCCGDVFDDPGEAGFLMDEGGVES